MEIEIQTENFELTKDLEAYIHQNLGFDDSDQYGPVSHVHVKLSEMNDAGEKSKNCFITVTLDGMPAKVEVQNTEEDMNYAIDLASKRARKTALLWIRRYGAKTA